MFILNLLLFNHKIDKSLQFMIIKHNRNNYEFYKYFFII